MGKLLGLLGGWKGYAAAASIAALIAAVSASYLTALPYRLTIAKMEAASANADLERANAVLERFTQNAKRIAGVADTFLAFKTTLDARFASINGNLADAIRNSPLPDTCRPDAVRVQSLSAAIAAANSATGPAARPAVPPAH